MRSDQAGGAIVKCISLDEYRKALIRAKIVKSDKPDNVGRSIRRILNDLENKGITASYEDFIWIPDKPDKTGRTKNK